MATDMVTAITKRMMLRNWGEKREHEEGDHGVSQSRDRRVARRRPQSSAEGITAEFRRGDHEVSQSRDRRVTQSKKPRSFAEGTAEWRGVEIREFHREKGLQS